MATVSAVSITVSCRIRLARRRIRLASLVNADKSGNMAIPLLSDKCDVVRAKTSRFFELALVLVRFDDVAHFIVNVNHSIM